MTIGRRSKREALAEFGFVFPDPYGFPRVAETVNWSWTVDGAKDWFGKKGETVQTGSFPDSWPNDQEVREAKPGGFSNHRDSG